MGESKEIILLNKAFDEVIRITDYLHLIRTEQLNHKSVIVDLQSVSESSAYLLCLLYDIHKKKEIHSPYTNNLSYRIEEYFDLNKHSVSMIYELNEVEGQTVNNQAL